MYGGPNSEKVNSKKTLNKWKEIEEDGISDDIK